MRAMKNRRSSGDEGGETALSDTPIYDNLSSTNY
jgi:hypothetical protein